MTVPEIKEKWLLIETGYEGIKHLCWLSEDKDEILKKREEFINVKIKQKEEDNEILKKEMPDLELSPVRPRQYYADFFCVQKWDGKEFACACDEFQVNPSQLMLR